MNEDTALSISIVPLQIATAKGHNADELCNSMHAQGQNRQVDTFFMTKKRALWARPIRQRSLKLILETSIQNAANFRASLSDLDSRRRLHSHMTMMNYAHQQ